MSAEHITPAAEKNHYFATLGVLTNPQPSHLKNTDLVWALRMKELGHTTNLTFNIHVPSP